MHLAGYKLAEDVHKITMLQYGVLQYIALRLLEFQLKTDIIERKNMREMSSDEFVMKDLMTQRPPKRVLDVAKVFANMPLGSFDPEKVWAEAKKQKKV